MSPVPDSVPVRKPIEELWPSPIARTLITKRTLPGLVPAWSGCSTMLGLQRAAPSMAYSLVKVAPSSKRRVEKAAVLGPDDRRAIGVPQERLVQPVMSTSEACVHIVITALDFFVRRARSRRRTAAERDSCWSNPCVPARTGGLRLRDLSATRWAGLRRTKLGPCPITAGRSERAVACCSVERRASVDSVPWFRFAPASSKPSKAPTCIRIPHGATPLSLSPKTNRRQPRFPPSTDGRDPLAAAPAHASARAATSIGAVGRTPGLRHRAITPHGGHREVAMSGLADSSHSEVQSVRQRIGRPTAAPRRSWLRGATCSRR